MTPDAGTMESDTLRKLRLKYEGRGFTFHANPSRELVPPFLSEFRPAAIAVGPDGRRSIVIEIRDRPNPVEAATLRELPTKAREEGWDLEVVFGARPEDGPRIAMPTPEQIEARLNEIQDLVEAGQRVAALITGWAALESLARLARADLAEGRVGGLSPVQAVQVLAEEGYLENDDASELRDMAKLRDAVIHGDLSVDVPAERAETLLRHLRAIAADIARVASGEDAG